MLIASTTPSADTVATAGSEDVQVTDLSTAVEGVTVAVSVADLPSNNLMEVLSNVTPVTSDGSIDASYSRWTKDLAWVFSVEKSPAREL